MSDDSALRLKLGQKIREIRSAKGLTGKKLAEISKISPAYLSEVERGMSEISGEKLARIAEALGINVQDLISPRQSTTVSNAMVSIPGALSEAAEELQLSFSTTIKILQGARSLTARRSSEPQVEWNKEDWIKFYKRVEFMFEEEK
jgi:transcriptional regulator with XRE-family HTH domain